MRMPAVSVLMTAFNRRQYIAAAIESVLAQTFDDFELLIVDDGSTDDTVTIARSYERRDPRVRVSLNDCNLGDYPNRNHAATLARGRFLKYHDSDDLMYPHCLATMVAGLDAYPAAGFALSASGHWHGGPSPMLSTPRLSYEREFLGSGLFMCGPACAMFRTEVFRSLGGFENVGVISDHLFWLRACARVPVVLVSGDLFYYRVHDGQELRSERAELDRLSVSRLVWKALNAAECPLPPAERELARRNHAYVTARESLRNVLERRPHLALRRLRTAGLTVGEWVRYLRPPRRSASAGTPSLEPGESLLSGPVQRT